MSSDRNYVSLEDNSSREIDNPLARIHLSQLDEDAKAFARRVSKHPDYALWIKAARIARDPLDYENVQGITDYERDAIAREKMYGFWGQSRTLRVTISTLCIAAIIQGWSQTGLNGANQTWIQDLKLTDQNNNPLGTWAVWVYGGVNATVYLTAAFFGCWLSDPLQGLIIGRRGAIFISASLCLAAAIGSAFVTSWQQLLGCRAVLGAGMGAKASVTPIYGAEASPTHLRGALIMNWQLFDAFGIMLGFSANLILSNVGDLSWRVQLASLALPCICLLCLIPTIPESPRWLLKKGRLNEAFASFCVLRETSLQAAIELFYANAQVQAEIRLLPRKKLDADAEAQGNEPVHTVAHPTDLRRPRQTTIAPGSSSSDDDSLRSPGQEESDEGSQADKDWDCLSLRGRLKRLWRSLTNNYDDSDLDDFQRCARGTYYITRILQLFRIKRTRRATVAAAIVNIAQQMCGVNILQFYSSTLFQGGTFSQGADGLWLSWGIGIGNFVFTLPVYWLIDRQGRRALLLSSYPGMTICMLGASLSCLIRDDSPRLGATVFWLYFFIFFYSWGQGPVPFAYSSEVFPLINREAGMSFAVFINFFGAGILALFVPQITLSLSTGSSDDLPKLKYAHGEARLLAIFTALNIVAFFLIYLFVPETAGATLGPARGVQGTGFNYISLEELNYIFGVPTWKHANYQLRHMLPWAMSMVKYYFERYVLRRKVSSPGAARQVYSWVSIRSLEEERQKREKEMQKKEEKKKEAARMDSLAPGHTSSTS